MGKTFFFRTMALLIMLISFSSLSFGQFQGPKPTDRTYTAKEIKDNASRLDRSDELVKIKGFIVKQINENTYEFRDNTGTIRLEIDDKRLPDRPFDESTELIFIGEIDHDLFEPVEMEVKEVQFVKED